MISAARRAFDWNFLKNKLAGRAVLFVVLALALVPASTLVWAALIKGTPGNDTLYGTNDADTIYGYAGDDKIYPRGGANVAYGGLGADLISVHVDYSPQIMHGQDGNDRIGSGCGPDQLYGETGNDWIGGNAGDDFIYGGSGADTLDGGSTSGSACIETPNNDYMDGGIGNDIIYGGSQNDKLYGGAGGDRIYGDVSIGGSYCYPDDPFFPCDDFIDGGEGHDKLYGNQGDDEIIGGGGIDIILDGIGTDKVNAGDGDDFVSLKDDSTYDFIDCGAGFDNYTLEDPYNASTNPTGNELINCEESVAALSTLSVEDLNENPKP